METITKEDGTTVDVFTAEELEAQKQEAIEQYKLENPDKSQEITELQKELEGLKNKDLNFSNLRKQKEDAEAKIVELTKGFDDKISSAKKEVLEGVMIDHYNDNLKNLSGGDEELKKKIEYHYKRISDTPNTKEGINSKLRDAWVLATKQDDPGALSAVVISSGSVSVPKVTVKNNLTAEEKEFGKKLGLSDEDLK